MNKHCTLLLLVSLAALPSCCPKKKKKENRKKKNLNTEVNIPLASDQIIQSFFDADTDEFIIKDPNELGDTDNQVEYNINTPSDNDSFAWVEEPTSRQEEDFEAVYFGFDQYNIKDNQEESVAHDVQIANKAIATYESEKDAPRPTLVIEGHADNAAGSRAYNLALSERRAKVLADRLIAEDVPREYITVVGRGQEFPALVDGEICKGDRDQQWANRRDEIRIIYG